MPSSTCHFIWPNNIMFSSQHDSSKGGVVTLLLNHLHYAIILHGSEPMHKNQLGFLSINSHYFGVVYGYASNDAMERSQLWAQIDDNLPPTTWVMCGDFNVVEVAFDKDVIFPFHWTTREREA